MSAQLVAGADSLLASRLLASAATFRSRRFALRSSVSSFASRSPLDITPLTSRGVDKACLTPKRSLASPQSAPNPRSASML